MKRKSGRGLWSLVICLTFAATCSQALDLSNFQGFMRRSAPPPKLAARTLSGLGPGKSAPAAPYYELESDADASYQQHQLVTLGDRPQKGESFSLPPETRVPEGLRPLLTDRKYPRQGVSLSGMTGSILTPSPGVLEPGKSAFSVHAQPFDLYNINDTRFQDEAYFETSIKMVYGVMEGLELGVDRVYSNQDRFDIKEPFFLNFKYQVPGNITLGGSFSTDSQAAYHTAWVGAGVPVAWIGVGVNFGAGNYHFSYNGWDNLKRSRFGGYNYQYDRGEGYADPVYFMVGGAVPLGENAHFLYDFNGDRFGLGFRINYQRTLYFDAAYISDGDYERLPGAIAHRRNGNFVFGGTVAY